MRPHRNYPRQPVGWGTFTEAPPPVVAPYVEARPADWLLLAVLRPAWAYRLELSLIVLLAVVYVWLGGTLGREEADRVIVAAAFVVALVGWTREPLARSLARSHIRRRWALACRHAELASRNDRVPWVMRCALTRAGEQLRVRLPAGAQVPDLESAAERLAAFLAVREVRVSRDPANARYARVVVLRRDPLADPAPIPWPLVKAGGARCGSRSRSARTRTATRSPSPCPSATCWPVGSRARASPPSSRSSSPPPPWTLAWS